MTKKELIDALIAKSGVNRKDVEAVIAALPETIKDEIRATGESAVYGLGTFKVSERAARTGRNPSTGAAIEIPASKVVSIKLTKDLRTSAQ